MTKSIPQNPKAILSLFDFTGNWSKPYMEQGYEVVRIDLQRGFDLMDWDYKVFPRTYFKGILAAVPCTDFAISGAKWFTEKDQNGSTFESIVLIYKTLAIIQWFRPGLNWWVIENPMSRIHKLCPELEKVSLRFNPYEFAGHDPIPRNSQYQKQTWLWGNFKEPLKKPLANIDGAKYYNSLGGGSTRTKNARSATPLGFAYAFARANP